MKILDGECLFQFCGQQGTPRWKVTRVFYCLGEKRFFGMVMSYFVRVLKQRCQKKFPKNFEK